jgi:hypothetical protein
VIKTHVSRLDKTAWTVAQYLRTIPPHIAAWASDCEAAIWTSNARTPLAQNREPLESARPDIDAFAKEAYGVLSKEIRKEIEQRHGPVAPHEMRVMVDLVAQHAEMTETKFKEHFYRVIADGRQSRDTELCRMVKRDPGFKTNVANIIKNVQISVPSMLRNDVARGIFDERHLRETNGLGRQDIVKDIFNHYLPHIQDTVVKFVAERLEQAAQKLNIAHELSRQGAETLARQLVAEHSTLSTLNEVVWTAVDETFRDIQNHARATRY